MPSVNSRRERVTRLVYENLADPDFRDHLNAVASDGSRPIFVALPEDPMERVLLLLGGVGGTGNIAVPMANGIIVVSMIHSDELAPGTKAEALTSDCTVGVFIARLMADGGEAQYRFVSGANSKPEGGRAELVAVGR